MENEKNFNNVLYALPDRLIPFLQKLSDCVKSNASEIRLRAGLPLALTVKGETVFVRQSGQTQFFISNDALKVTKSDLEECFKKLCNNSVYAHENELKNGYITMKNGCRAGICGNLSDEGFLTDISSVNIRIAREILGCANEIIKNYTCGGLLIAGPPCSGKTTVLRDLVRQLALGNTGRIKKVAVIDSRHEISGSSGGISLNDLGPATDVLICENKAIGIEIALRTMFPDVIAFDEICTVAELKSVSDSFCSGVDIITTAHIGSIEELTQRNVTYSLLKSGAISFIALLPRLHGDKIKFFSVKELLCDMAV
jgi:stage III sporulation protein AA